MIKSENPKVASFNRATYRGNHVNERVKREMNHTCKNTYTFDDGNYERGHMMMKMMKEGLLVRVHSIIEKVRRSPFGCEYG